METKEIQAYEMPLTSYHNFINKLSDRLNAIYYPKFKDTNHLILKNNLIYEDDSIKLFGFISLRLNKNKIVFRFIGDMQEKHRTLIEVTYENSLELYRILNEYLFYKTIMQEKYDDSITANMVNHVFDEIYINKNKTQIYNLPYKTKLFRYYSKQNFDLKNNDFWDKFDFGLKAYRKNIDEIFFEIVKIYSQKLDESKNIKNIQALDYESIFEGTCKLDDLHKFLTNLYFFGELNEVLINYPLNKN